LAPLSFWSSTGVTGLVQIDENGDRETDFALWDMNDTNTSVFQVLNTHTSLSLPRILRLLISRTLRLLISFILPVLMKLPACVHSLCVFWRWEIKTRCTPEALTSGRKELYSS
jgi:hypothetical protein